MAIQKNWIWVTFQRRGFHFYPEAANDPTLEDVKYLGSKHRHLFKFKVWIEVFHGNRDLEFHQVLNYCESLLENEIDINGKSVEMLGEDLRTELYKKYPGRDMKIEVSEDGECGCILEYKQMY